MEFIDGSVRGLGIYLRDNGLIRQTSDLSLLKDTTVGFEAISLTQRHAMHLQSACGAPSAAIINSSLAKEQEILSSLNIQRIIVHASQVNLSATTNNVKVNAQYDPLLQERCKAWLTSDTAPKATAHKLRTMGNYVHPTTVNAVLTQLLHAAADDDNQNTIIHAPSTALSQFRHLYQHHHVHAVMHNLDALLYGIGHVILKLDLEMKSMEYVLLEDVLNHVNMDYGEFLHTCLLAGYGRACMTFPALDKHIVPLVKQEEGKDDDDGFAMVSTKKKNTKKKNGARRKFSYDNALLLMRTHNYSLDDVFAAYEGQIQQAKKRRVAIDTTLKGLQSSSQAVLSVEGLLVAQPVDSVILTRALLTGTISSRVARTLVTGVHCDLFPMVDTAELVALSKTLDTHMRATSFFRWHGKPSHEEQKLTCKRWYHGADPVSVSYTPMKYISTINQDVKNGNQDEYDSVFQAALQQVQAKTGMEHGCSINVAAMTSLLEIIAFPPSFLTALAAAPAKYYIHVFHFACMLHLQPSLWQGQRMTLIQADGKHVFVGETISCEIRLLARMACFIPMKLKQNAKTWTGRLDHNLTGFTSTLTALITALCDTHEAVRASFFMQAVSEKDAAQLMDQCTNGYYANASEYMLNTSSSTGALVQMLFTFDENVVMKEDEKKELMLAFPELDDVTSTLAEVSEFWNVIYAFVKAALLPVCAENDHAGSILSLFNDAENMSLMKQTSNCSLWGLDEMMTGKEANSA